jgi:hypothetical protein
MRNNQLWWLAGALGIALLLPAAQASERAATTAATDSTGSALLAPQPDAPVLFPVKASVSPDTVQGGQSFQCTVTMGAVSFVDRTVQISTDHPEVFANLPSSVVVPAGQQSVTFTVLTNSVSSTVAATITATYGSDQSSCQETVTP